MIKDNGIGIPPEVMPGMFGLYERGSKEAKQISGSGIGLFLSKKLIDLHHGRIWAESQGKNWGSRFCFSLPIKAKQ